MHIAIITAGGAGMFCGSCMHDNTWARALRAAGCEVTLIPTYTPIRVDEQDQSEHEVYLGGINLYLEFQLPLWRRLPRMLTRWLDAPRVLNLTRFASNDARKLGPLTVAMLDGDDGPQRRATAELVAFLADELRPDAIVFSNALLAGTLRPLREKFTGRIFCTLQGDDVFLEDLPTPYRAQAIERITARAADFDGFLVHSRYYRDFMADYLRLPVERFHRIPLGIDLSGHDGIAAVRDRGSFTVGYFARICPEKGLHRLLEAFRLLHARRPHTRLVAGGYLGRRDARYFRRLVREARPLGDAFVYAGSPMTHEAKVELLKSFDVLSVPTEYHEPKGLYVLEALANGVPVVQPRHGAFPELIEATGGGLLVEPNDPEALAAALERLLDHPHERYALAAAGQRSVREQFNDRLMAEETLAVLSGSADVRRDAVDRLRQEA
ncbi:MAG: glycosyltransferase family 4 protein [Planctomycetes bacterium]|nr:glycosyltransferase family 4 protein [Planctomycetota bacterium]